MAGFVRVAPAPALVAGGGLAFAESALDHAELKVPNVALTLGRIPRQRHYPGLQSQHSVTTGATPPSASRTTTSRRATEVRLAVASGTESRIGSGAAAMAVRHLERGILHSCGPTLSAPPWRRLPSRCPEVAAPAHIDVMRRAVAAPRDSPASLRVIWTHPPGQYRVVLGRTPPPACGSSQAASRPVTAMETLTKQFESRVTGFLERTGLKPSKTESPSQPNSGRMPPDTFTHLLTQPPGQTDLCLPQCSDDLLRSVSLPSHPDLLAEKLQTRSILTLHLVSLQGVRSEDLNGVQGVAGSNPAVPI